MTDTSSDDSSLDSSDTSEVASVHKEAEESSETGESEEALSREEEEEASTADSLLEDSFSNDESSKEDSSNEEAEDVSLNSSLVTEGVAVGKSNEVEGSKNLVEVGTLSSNLVTTPQTIQPDAVIEVKSEFDSEEVVPSLTTAGDATSSIPLLESIAETPEVTLNVIGPPIESETTSPSGEISPTSISAEPDNLPSMTITSVTENNLFSSSMTAQSVRTEVTFGRLGTMGRSTSKPSFPDKLPQEFDDGSACPIHHAKENITKLPASAPKGDHLETTNSKGSRLHQLRNSSQLINENWIEESLERPSKYCLRHVKRAKTLSPLDTNTSKAAPPPRNQQTST